MAAETTPGFLIDGAIYEAPDIGSLSMGERRLMFELTGYVGEDFAQEEGESDDDHEVRVSKLTRHPGFMEMLMQIAYQRGNPTVKRDKVKLVIENTVYVEAITPFADAEGDDALPPASTTEPEPSSPRRPVESSESSGDDSRKSSDGQVVQLAPITTTESDTSSTSAQTGSTA